MKADIFFVHGEQDALRRRVESTMRRLIFEDLEITQRPIDRNHSESSSESRLENFRLFQELFVQATDCSNAFHLVVDDEEGGWSYASGSKTGATKESTSGKKAEKQLVGSYISTYRSRLTTIFPAVALRNRLVIVRRGAVEAFHEWSDDLTWLLKPLAFGGAQLIDLSNAPLLESGIRSIARHLTSELTAICSRQMELRGTSEPNATEIATLLDVDALYVEQQLKRILPSLLSFTPTILSGPVSQGRPSQVILSLEKSGGREVPGVNVRIRGPRRALDTPTIEEILNFPSGDNAKREISFYVTAPTAPYCPIEVLMNADDEPSGYVPLSSPVVLDVTP